MSARSIDRINDFLRTVIAGQQPCDYGRWQATQARLRAEAESILAEPVAQHVHTIECRAKGCSISSWLEDLRPATAPERAEGLFGMYQRQGVELSNFRGGLSEERDIRSRHIEERKQWANSAAATIERLRAEVVQACRYEAIEILARREAEKRADAAELRTAEAEREGWLAATDAAAKVCNEMIFPQFRRGRLQSEVILSDAIIAIRALSPPAQGDSNG